MSCYGIIFCGFNCADTLEESLAPWIAAREWRLGGHDWVISAISVPFTGFPQETLDRTHEILTSHFERGYIDFLNKGTDKTWTEVQARGMALQDLVSAGCSLSWQVDSDENYEVGQIARIVAFVEARPFVDAWKLSLKNYVGLNGDDKTYLVEPFQPMRLHRLHLANGLCVDRFYQDNNVCYTRPGEQDKPDNVVADVQLAVATVPPGCAWISHQSWPPTIRSRRKCEYQLSRAGWKPDFAWDDSRGGLVWRDGVVPKETARDDS